MKNGNLKIVVDGEELARNINKKKKPMSYNPTDAHSVENNINESVSSISLLNIVNQLSKHDFSYVYIFLLGT